MATMGPGESVRVEIGHDDVHALAKESLRDGQTDRTSCTGNDANRATKTGPRTGCVSWRTSSCHRSISVRDMRFKQLHANQVAARTDNLWAGNSRLIRKSPISANSDATA